jgi:hypothetical protein
MVFHAMATKPNWRAISIHRSYTVDEARRALGVSKATVRRWIKAGLPVIPDTWPRLIHGPALLAYCKPDLSKKVRCLPGECYCVKCRAPRTAAFGEAEIITASAASVNIRALCPDCSTLIHQRVSWARLPSIASILRLRAPQALRHLIDQKSPCLNVHFEPE